MKNFTLQEITDLTGGTLIVPDGFSDREYELIIIDSRVLIQKNNTLFFALKGVRNNGHNFINGLIKKGVDAFVVSDTDIISKDAAYILVKDTTAALQKVASANRLKYTYPVIGITGSNGKTIVKEWLNDLLSIGFKIVRSPKSYNSQTGVPLSAILMDENFNLAILEAGISKLGEMNKIAGIIAPTIGILTNIGDAHQENFHSKEEKLQEKLLLFNSAEKLVYKVDEPEYNYSIKNFCTQNNVEEISWSLKGNPATINFKLQIINGKTFIEATINEKIFRLELNLTDTSSIENACHCFAAIYALTGKPDKYLEKFSGLEPIAMRLEIKKGINNCILINDYYNSDLASLNIALSVLYQQAQRSSQKKQVILSDIQQTGLSTHNLYDQVNKLLNLWKIDELTGIGPEISKHQNLFTSGGNFYPSTEVYLDDISLYQPKDSIVLIKGAREYTFEKISAMLQEKTHQTRLEINLNALVDNLNIYKSLLKPETSIMVMVKAFSYGSGDIEIARVLQHEQVDYLAVAVADEGIELRRAGIQIPIIVMNPEEQSFNNIIEYQLEPNIYNFELLKQFEKAVIQSAKSNFPIHIKLDTGMNRLGFKTTKEVDDLISFLKGNTNFTVRSVFSHLAASDDPSLDSFTRAQIKQYNEWSLKITSAFDYKILRHLLNSAGIERFPEWQMDMVRLGIGLYGVSATGLSLQKISTFKSIVSQVKKAYPGETAGYSRKERIDKETDIAIVPVGYADGMDRKLGNRNGVASINNSIVPIIGNICMDMLLLDVTGKNVQRGEEVEFFGSHISISEIAERAGTIPYEILTGISQRVKRIYLFE